jgi:ABC-type multidrug transport system fused ATPase/permease subunit
MEADTLYHDSTPVGNLVNVITTETNMAASGIMSPLELIVLFIMLFGYLLMLLFLSWQMTLSSVAIFFIATKIPKIWIKQSASAGRNLVNANILVSEFLVGRLRSPRLVRLSGTKIAEKNEFNKLTKAQREHSVFTAILGVKTDVSMEPVLISLSLIFLYFSYSTLGLQVEVIGLYLVIVLRTLPIVKGILSKWQRIQRLLGSVEVIEDRLELMKNSIENDPGVESISQLKQSFTIDNVSYRYPSSGSDALKNIKIIFKANEMTAVVGASGSGKSTLIDLLPRLRTPTKGLIKIDDVNIEKYTLKSIREMISYAPQSPQIFDGTVRNHILYGKVDATESEVQEAIRLAGAEEFINQLPQGIDTILGEDAIKLSGGQRQRLDLARVLVKKTPILILDEPTSSLDVESESLFKQVLYKIRKERSTTIIIVSHRLASIFDADNIVVLNQGRVDGYGKHLDLLSQNGWYAKAWKTQK